MPTYTATQNLVSAGNFPLPSPFSDVNLVDSDGTGLATVTLVSSDASDQIYDPAPALSSPSRWIFNGVEYFKTTATDAGGNSVPVFTSGTDLGFQVRGIGTSTITIQRDVLTRNPNFPGVVNAEHVESFLEQIGIFNTSNPSTRTFSGSLTQDDGAVVAISVTPPIVPNSAPVLGGTPPNDTATEDVATAIDLSAYNISDADGDTITLTLAVNRGTIASIDGNGTTAGVTVANSGTTSMTLQGSAASLNTYLNNTAKITFLTGVNDINPATLTVTPNDGTVNGTADSVTINITPVNDAPVLNTSGSPVLTTIVEDAGDDDGSGADGDDDATQNANNPGTTVGTIIVNGSISDPDGTSTEAMAVTGVDNTNGFWQYSTNGGTSWTNFSGSTGNVALSAPRLLDTNNLVRFVPNADFNGTATFTYRAWDKTTGTAGQTGGTSTGGASSLSTAVETATITVSPVNDLPVFSGLDGTPAFTEGGPSVVLDNNVTVSDKDLDALNGGAGNYSGASLTVAQNFASAVDFFSVQSGGNLAVLGGPNGVAPLPQVGTSSQPSPTPAPAGSRSPSRTTARRRQRRSSTKRFKPSDTPTLRLIRQLRFSLTGRSRTATQALRAPVARGRRRDR